MAFGSSGWSLGKALRGLFSKSDKSEHVDEVPVDEPSLEESPVDEPPLEQVASEPEDIVAVPEEAITTAPKAKPTPTTPVKKRAAFSKRREAQSTLPPKPAKKTKPSTYAVITDDTWSDLEDVLLQADFGPEVADSIVQATRTEVERIGSTRAEDVVAIVKDALEERLAAFDSTLRLTERPAVVMVVGVNGVGKTTTIGKFAKFLTKAGRSVLIAAADTFRAAAVEQLGTWAERAGATLVRPDKEGQDPASVAYQAVEKAAAEGIEIVIIDTAGRLHTKSGLMDELSKIRRVVEKVAPVSEVLLVLDATTGQNGVVQAEAFLEHAGVTGLVITKLDGSAKAGFVVRVQEVTKTPVKLLGQGEGIDDMTGFSPRAFAASLTD